MVCVSGGDVVTLEEFEDRFARAVAVVYGFPSEGIPPSVGLQAQAIGPSDFTEDEDEESEGFDPFFVDTYDVDVPSYPRVLEEFEALEACVGLLEHVLQKEPPKTIEAYIRAAVYNETPRAISKNLGIQTSTVTTYVSDARRALRHYLGRATVFRVIEGGK